MFVNPVTEVRELLRRPERTPESSSAATSAGGHSKQVSLVRFGILPFPDSSFLQWCARFCFITISKMYFFQSSTSTFASPA